MVKNLFNEVLANLLSEQYFSVFTYRKRDCCLLKTNELGFEAIELQYWEGFDLTSGKKSLVIKPLYLKRFNVLHKWFEKFSFKSKVDQRDNYSIGFDGGMLKEQNLFYFALDKTDFQNETETFTNEIIRISTYVFNKFLTLEDLFEYQINPLLNHSAKLPDVGADWVFEFLTLCKIVEPLRYSILKEIILKQIELMYNRNEPNIIEYYPKFKEITEYLESLNLV